MNVVVLRAVLTADRREFESRIGRLESDDLAAVFTELDRLIGR